MVCAGRRDRHVGYWSTGPRGVTMPMSVRGSGSGNDGISAPEHPSVGY